MRAPAAFVAVPLLIGSAVGLLLYDVSPGTTAVCALGGALLSGLAALGAFADDDAWMCTAAVVCGALLAGTTLGVDAARRAYAPSLLTWFQSVRPERAAGSTVLEGVLREDASRGPAGVSLLVDVASVRTLDAAEPSRPVTGGVRLSVAGSLAASHAGSWRSGRRLRVTAQLREPTVYLNPGRPDDRRALARRGIVLVGSVKSAALVDVIAPAGPVTEAAGHCRAWARARLSALVGKWSDRSGGISAAILVGDRTGLSAADERRLQEAGTYHVVAISGGNIAMLTLLLLSCCRLFRAPPRVAASITILLLVFYGRVTGPAPSIDRAITAAVAYLAGRLLDQRGPAVNVLATAAILAVAVAPAAVFDPGFILSFGATLGILMLVPRLLEWGPPARAAAGDRGADSVIDARAKSRPCGRRGAWLTVVAGLLAATTAAEIALAPVGAAFFSRITFAGLLLNFGAIPMMGLVQAASLAALMTSPLSADLGAAAGYVAHVGATGLVESSRLLDAAPWLSRDVAAPAWWLVAAYYASLLTALMCRATVRVAVPLAIAGGALMVSSPGGAVRESPPALRPGWLRVVVLDVGQGDATLVQLPDRRTLLVDAGGIPVGVSAATEGEDSAVFDVGDRVVAPALRTLGVRRLDTFVLTHPDPDHLGGAAAILRAFAPRTVWEGVPVPPHRPLAALGAAADAAGAEWRTVQAGDRLRVGAVTIRVLHPPPPEWERQRVRNEDSVVLDVRMGRVSAILPGDIGREGEHAILAHLDPAPVVILKAAHHGSATSSSGELLAALRPRVVVFSAGRANRFGHPAPAVVARYQAMGTTIFSTAEDGAVFVDTNGEAVEVWAWHRQKKLALQIR